MIQRRKPIGRSRLKAKRTPVRKRRPGPPRRGPMRDLAYRRWIRELICIVYGPGRLWENLNCVTAPTDAAHTENNGMSSKGPDSSCVPLCRVHHREYDAGREAFERKYNVNMRQIAARFYDRYQAENHRYQRPIPANADQANNN